MMDSQEIESKIAELLPQLDSADFKEDGIDPVLLFAAKTEKRRRDTQASYTRSQQELKKTQLLSQKMAETLETELVKVLPAQAAAELEELKHQDPDAWRAKITELENTRKSQVQEQLQAIEQEAGNKSELEVRIEQLRAFQEANPTVTINDEVIENDIPPRITKKLETGKISFGEFLEECRVYLAKGKVVDKGDTPTDIPDLGSASGSSSKPVGKPSKSQYEKEIY